MEAVFVFFWFWQTPQVFEKPVGSITVSTNESNDLSSSYISALGIGMKIPQPDRRKVRGIVMDSPLERPNRTYQYVHLRGYP